jgi:acetoin utilization deacetylase AcuC-like enzyme
MSTAYCFDPEHVHHRERGHPERPERLAAVMARLQEKGLLQQLVEYPVGEASLEAIQRVHSVDYILSLEAACVRGFARLDVDTYVTDASFRLARRARGGLLHLVDAVMQRRADNGFALIRPPGHHARPFASMGFCLFGNVAAAARHAQARYGIERVLIVDFDVHHGNGTQEIFYEDPDVLVVSSHQHPCYPGTGMAREVGSGAGTGATLNIPYPPGTGDEQILRAYREVVLPVADRFRPELVLVSAGFDAHHLDPLADGAMSAGGFGELMRLLLGIADAHCGGRLVAALEGGYHSEALAESVRACITVMHDPQAGIEDAIGASRRPQPDLGDLLEELRRLHGLG